jgi:circadian clock protein KaiC
MEENNRVKTGIAGFDKMLNGGYISNSVNLLSGCSGTGKTLFALSFIYEGATAYGEKGLYITLEEDISQIVKNCRTIGMDIESIHEEKITLFDLASLRKMYTTKEEFERKDSPIDIQALIELIKRNSDGVKRLAIDSVVPLSLRYPNLNEFRSELFRLRMVLKEMNMTCLLTTEIQISSKDISRFGIEDFIADSVTVLKPTEDGSNFIRVHKLRGSDHLKDAVRYEVTSTGLRVAFDDFKVV